VEITEVGGFATGFGRSVSDSPPIPTSSMPPMTRKNSFSAPRLHPGITQEIAPNESQRKPEATTREARVYEALFVAPWLKS
jgi:hypothetical protein